MGIPKRSAEVMESLLRYGRGIKTTETNGPTENLVRNRKTLSGDPFPVPAPSALSFPLSS